VNEAVADATEREGLVDYLPVVVDEDVELEFTRAEVDQTTNVDNLEDRTRETLDLDDEEGGEFDEVYVRYEDDDGHIYDATVRTFEDSQDADAYEEALREGVEDSEYDEDITRDAEVVRDGDTVVYLYGESDGTEDYDTYNFYAVASQY